MLLKHEANKKKFEIFLEVAGELNKAETTPVLFGSLGLMKIVGEFKEADDVDILMEKKESKEEKRKLLEVMFGLGFKLKDEKRYEFEREGEVVSFTGFNKLPNFEISPNDFKVSEERGIKFKELSAKDYLLFYRNMLKKKERQKEKGKDDQKKITVIKQYLREKN